MLNSSLSNYSDTYILAKGTITIPETGEGAAERNANVRSKLVKLKKSATFTDCINRIKNTQIDNSRDLGVTMSMYNNDYAKTRASLETCLG